MRIYIGADHNGFHLKEKIEAYLRKRGLDVVDNGDEQLNPEDDFPVFASKVASGVLSDPYGSARGILICGSGQGMVMAANRHKGVRAGLGWSVEAARGIRHDEDSNVLALPSELFRKDESWKDIIDTWLATPFAGAERFKRRNRQLDEL